MKQVLLVVIIRQIVLSYLRKIGDGRKRLVMTFYLCLWTKQMHAK